MYTSVNKNKYISGDQFLSANDLEFGQEFKSVANMVGLQLNAEQLQAAFVQFKSHHNRYPQVAGGEPNDPSMATHRSRYALSNKVRQGAPP